MPDFAIDAACRHDRTQHQLRRVPLAWRKKHAPAPIAYRNAMRNAPPRG
ncbi:hypothetical protein [Cupriavidus sp. TMH.W2]